MPSSSHLHALPSFSALFPLEKGMRSLPEGCVSVPSPRYFFTKVDPHAASAAAVKSRDIDHALGPRETRGRNMHKSIDYTNSTTLTRLFGTHDEHSAAAEASVCRPREIRATSDKGSGGKGGFCCEIEIGLSEFVGTAEESQCLEARLSSCSQSGPICHGVVSVCKANFISSNCPAITGPVDASNFLR